MFNFFNKKTIDIDEYNQVINNAKNALAIRNFMLTEKRAIAITLALDEYTAFKISFVPLLWAVPVDLLYDDGSDHGIQINIDRIGSYAVPLGSFLYDSERVCQKWGVSQGDADLLFNFFNTVITGFDYFAKSSRQSK